MNPCAMEEMAWERLKDTQREAENRRLMAGPHPTWASLGRLATWAWLKGRLATRRPHRHPVTPGRLIGKEGSENKAA